MSRHRLLIALPIVFFVAHATLHRDWIVDDAGITFAFARNLALGHGLVAQPGADPVEGFSNPTWVFLYGLLNWLGLYHEVWTAKVLGLLFAIGVFHLLRRLSSCPAAAGLGCCLLSLHPSFVIWNQSGLENPLYAFLVVWLCERSIHASELPGSKRTAMVVVLAVALALTRPDGLLWAAGYPMLLILRCARRDIDVKATGRHLGTYTIAYAALIALCFTARYAYFGEWVPNTYLAKGSGTISLAVLAVLKAIALVALTSACTLLAPRWSHRTWTSVGVFGLWWLVLLALGQKHLLRSLAGDVGPPLAAAVLTTLCRCRERRPATEASLLLFLVLAATDFNSLPRDWMGEFRFATPLFPFFLLLLAESIMRARRRAILVTVLIATSAVYYGARTWRYARAPTLDLHAVAEFGENTLAPIAGFLRGDGLSILAPDVGGLLLHSGLRVYDVGMLCDRRIAQSIRTDKPAFYDYVFEEVRPSIIWLHPPWDSLAALGRDARFRRDYVAVWEDTADPETASGMFVRKNLLDGVGALDGIRRRLRGN